MHNSFFIRDMLRDINASSMVRERRDPHRLLMRDPAAFPAPDDIELSGAWRVETSGLGEVGVLLQADVVDFLCRFGVTIAADAVQTITFHMAGDLGKRDFRLHIAPAQVRIEGGGTAGLWAGLAWLEFELQTRRAPFLPAGVTTRRAGWGTQISQGPWGANYSVPDFAPEYLSDDCFRLYAHYGVNNMMIYGDLLCYTNSSILPELNHPDYQHHIAMLRDAAVRAARYGVQFCYVPVGPKLKPDHPVFLRHPEVCGHGVERYGLELHFLCSGSEIVQEFYRETFGNLFRQAPELAGLLLIVGEESFYHCKMWNDWRQHVPSCSCPRCREKTRAQGIAEVLYPVRDAVAKAQPAAYVAAWAYDYAGSDYSELLSLLPDGVAIFHQIEKDQLYEKAGYRKSIWDYSIDYQGPSDNMRLIHAIATEQQRPLFIKTETGIGLELFQFPYVPALQHLAEKWRRLRDLAPAGIHQSWLFYGMFGSRAEALGLWAAYAPEMTADEFLRRLALRDFGAEAAPFILESWAHMSAAMGHLPVMMLNGYYIGPNFLGPCHPLLTEKGETISPVFDGYLFYLQELGETFAHKHIDQTRTCLAIDDIAPWGGLPEPLPGETRSGRQILLDEYAEAAGAARRSWKKLCQAEPYLHTDADRQRFAEECQLTELVYRTLQACSHVAAFYTARDAGDIAAMRDIAIAERANAIAALPIYRQSPWLDFSMRIDGRYSPAAEMIAEKVRMIDVWLAATSESAS